MITRVLDTVRARGNTRQETFGCILATYYPFVVLVKLRGLSATVLLYVAVLYVVVVKEMPVDRVNGLINDILVFVYIIFTNIVVINRSGRGKKGGPRGALARGVGRGRSTPNVTRGVFRQTSA